MKPKIGLCKTCHHPWFLRARDIKMDNGKALYVNVPTSEDLQCAECIIKGIAHHCSRVMYDITPLPWEGDRLTPFPQSLIP